MNITIVGAGYVGLTTAVALAYLGHRVRGLEMNGTKLAQLRARESPIFEPGLDVLLRNVDQLSFTNDPTEALADADVVSSRLARRPATMARQICVR